MTEKNEMLESLSNQLSKYLSPQIYDLIFSGKQDVKINKLQRKIRKRVMLHLSVQANSPDLPYCLVLISLIKDVERIGDYAKDLSEIRAPGAPALPAGPAVRIHAYFAPAEAHTFCL